MTKKKKSIKDEMLDAFLRFDYPAYYKAKSRIRKMTPALKEIITRIETHPTFGKSKTVHKAWVKRRHKETESQTERQMMRDAVAGRHYKYGSVFYGGKVKYPKEYLEICKKVGVKIK